MKVIFLRFKINDWSRDKKAFCYHQNLVQKELSVLRLRLKHKYKIMKFFYIKSEMNVILLRFKLIDKNFLLPPKLCP